METKNLKKVDMLRIVGIAGAMCWQLGSSFAQSPIEQGVISRADLLELSVGSTSADENTSDALSNPTRGVSLASSVAPTSSTTSTPAQPSSIPWASLIANARANLRADSLPDPANAKQALENAAAQLQNFLSTASDDRFANWLTFLRWNDLNAELAKEDPDTEQLVQIERNMRQNYLGLELSPFVQVRERLADYIYALKFGGQPNETIELLGKRLEPLLQSLQSLPRGADGERQREIGLMTSFLRQSRQVPDLVQTIREGFSKPNVRVLVSRDFAERRLSRPVAEPNPVNEVILGTQIRGQSFLQGNVSPQLIDNPRNASLRLLLSGQLTSQNIGTNRGVRLHTRGNANVSASETVSLTDAGLTSQNDTSVHAPLRSSIQGIEHRLKIVRKIAAKKAAEQKPQADAIAQGRLERRVATQFHQQLREQLTRANARMLPAETPVFNRLGLTRPRRSSWSSGDFLSLLWKQQEGDQLAAPSSCPLVVQPHGVTIQLHQSALMNLLDPIIGGRIIRNEDLDDFATQAGLSPSDELKAEVSGEKWSISMATYHPVEVEFDDQLVRFRIRTTKLDRGDQALEQPATIEAIYKVALDNGAIQLERQGDVKIEFAGDAQRGLRAVTLRSFLKNKFDTVFKQELLDKPLRPTDRLPADAPSMTLTDIQVDDGWIQATLL